MQVHAGSAIQLIQKDEFITIQVDPAERMITLVWTGYAPSEAYRAILERALKAVEDMKLIRWMADLRGMDAILQMDEQWTVSDWFPRLNASCLRRMAILTSTDYFNQMAVDRIMDAGTATNPFAVAYFDNSDHARIWLQAAE